jgi:hypothetical protein
VFEVVAVGVVLLEEPSMFDGSGDDGLELGPLEGLEEIVDGAPTKGVGGYVNVVHCSGEDDRNLWVIGADLVKEGDPVPSRHHDVGEDEIESWVFAEDVQGFICIRCNGWVIAAAREHDGDDVADDGIIVHDKDSLLRHWLN